MINVLISVILSNNTVSTLLITGKYRVLAWGLWGHMYLNCWADDHCSQICWHRPITIIIMRFYILGVSCSLFQYNLLVHRTFDLLDHFSGRIQWYPHVVLTKQNKGSLSVWRVAREQGHTPLGNSLWISGQYVVFKHVPENSRRSHW